MPLQSSGLSETVRDEKKDESAEVRDSGVNEMPDGWLNDQSFVCRNKKY